MPASSPLRDPAGNLASIDAPPMQSIAPLIFILFVVPEIVYGLSVGKFKESKDVVGVMKKSLVYYVVVVFFVSLFMDAFGRSNLGALLALKGATFLKVLSVPAGVTFVGVIVLTAFINLIVGLASAKWALLSPVFLPMLMRLGPSPEFTQAAYRVGDSSTNIITPLSPYLPLFVVFARRYVSGTGFSGSTH